MQFDLHDPSPPAALPNSTSGSSALSQTAGTPGQADQQHQHRRDPVALWGLLGDRFLAAYLRVLAALLLPDTEVSSNTQCKATAPHSSSAHASSPAKQSVTEPLPQTVEVSASEVAHPGTTGGSSTGSTVPAPARRGRPPSSSKAVPAKGTPPTAQESGAAPAPQPAPVPAAAATASDGSVSKDTQQQGLSAELIGMLDAVIRGEVGPSLVHSSEYNINGDH
jgi:hypothetical protein